MTGIGFYVIFRGFVFPTDGQLAQQTLGVTRQLERFVTILE